MTDPSKPQEKPSGTFEIKGTGGIPNLRIVQDFATNPAELFFELHTQIKLKHEFWGPLSDALERRDFPALASLLVEHGELNAKVGKDQLAALLTVLFVVDG